MYVGQNIPALYGAPVMRTSSSLPVVMFSHGVAGMRTTYSAVCCDLASHGYLVAAIEHRSVCVCMRVCVCVMITYLYLIGMAPPVTLSLNIRRIVQKTVRNLWTSGSHSTGHHHRLPRSTFLEPNRFVSSM